MICSNSITNYHSDTIITLVRGEYLDDIKTIKRNETKRKNFLIGRRKERSRNSIRFGRPARVVKRLYQGNEQGNKTEGSGTIESVLISEFERYGLGVDCINQGRITSIESRSTGFAGIGERAILSVNLEFYV